MADVKSILKRSLSIVGLEAPARACGCVAIHPAVGMPKTTDSSCSSCARRCQRTTIVSRSAPPTGTSLKIDVEGGQVKVLQGAHRVLAESKPTIWFEHGDRSAGVYGSTREELWSLLQGHGYRVFTADGEGPLTSAEFDSDRLKRIWSFFAHS